MSAGFTLLPLAVLALAWALTLWLSRTRVLRLLDRPNERSLHTRPTPRTGGLAVVASLLLGIGALWLGTGWEPAGRPAALVCALVALSVLSLADDVRELGAFLRLAVQLVLVAIVVAGWGPRLQRIELPAVGGLDLGLLAVPLSVLAVLWMINLYNFMDGMDGFASGMTVWGFGFLGGLAAARGVGEVAWPALLTSAAAGGFLVHNWPPARIFLGDVGSVPLGFAAAVLSLWGVERGAFSLWAPVLVFSPFVVDATATLVKRQLRGETVWRPHRQHHYQRLVLAGWSHRRTTLAEYAVMAAAGASAVVYELVGPPARLLILLAWAGIYVVLSRAVARVEAQARRDG